MPLSKERSRLRARLKRAQEALDSVEPKSNLNAVQPVGLIMNGSKILGVKRVIKSPPRSRPKRRDEMSPQELGVTGYDADGYPIYDL